MKIKAIFDVTLENTMRKRGVEWTSPEGHFIVFSRVVKLEEREIYKVIDWIKSKIGRPLLYEPQLNESIRTNRL